MSEIFNDEIVSITYIGEEETIDINVSGNRLFFANGILTHNSAVDEPEHDIAHIAGGLSKVNTADNVMTILTSNQMKERGEYRLQFIKTRSSSGVGSKMTLGFDQTSLRITDMPEEGFTKEELIDSEELKEELKKRINIPAIEHKPEKPNPIQTSNKLLDMVKRINKE